MLIIYPHGLGDIILLTPALRALGPGVEPHVAVLSRFKGTEILDGCPYIEQVHYVLPDPWNDTNQKGCRQWGEKYAQDRGLTPVWIWHAPQMHKILYNAHSLDVELQGHRTEIWITDEHRETADGWLCGRQWPFGFLHCSTGMPGLSTAAAKKDFPASWGFHWLNSQGMSSVVEVGKSFSKAAFPMPVQFEIMRRASALCLADSVFYHAAHAMRKRVDLAYFGRGKGVHDRVKPLHEDCQEQVVWKLPKL